MSDFIQNTLIVAGTAIIMFLLNTWKESKDKTRLEAKEERDKNRADEKEQRDIKRADEKEQRDRSRSEVTAKKVEAVKETLQEVTAEARDEMTKIKEVAVKTHTLVNSNMGIVLQQVAELARWKAGQENTPENQDAAKDAERAYTDHQSKQAIVDSGEKIE